MALDGATADTSREGSSSKFASEPFTVYVGPNKTPHHVNRHVLSSKIPYFASLLSFPGTESTATNSCHLDTSVDTDDAFDMVLEFIYSGSYEPPDYLSEVWKAQTHAEVYVMAGRLMMADLMQVAVKHMARTLLLAVGNKTKYNWDQAADNWNSKTVPMMDQECIIQVLRIIYENTVEVDSANGKEGEGEGEGEGKGKGKGKGKGDQENSDGDINKKTITVPVKKMKRKSYQQMKKDPMRSLLAKYCGAQLGSLRKMPGFLNLIQEVGEFAKDIIMEVQPRSSLTESEAYAI